MSGAFIERVIDEIVEREGGYSDDKRDSGGKTRFGITENEARSYGYAGDMRELPVELAREIYRVRYYTGPGFDKVAELSELLAEELVDTGVNMGQDRASVFLQRCLTAFNLGGELYPDLVVDGDIGPATIDALRAYLAKRGKEGEQVLFRALNCLQGERFIYLAERRVKDEAFVYGWIRARVA